MDARYGVPRHPMVRNPAVHHRTRMQAAAKVVVNGTRVKTVDVHAHCAVPEALAVADRVAPPIEEDGAAQVLDELLEMGLIG